MLGLLYLVEPNPFIDYLSVILLPTTPTGDQLILRSSVTHCPTPSFLWRINLFSGLLLLLRLHYHREESRNCSWTPRQQQAEQEGLTAAEDESRRRDGEPSGAAAADARRRRHDCGIKRREEAAAPSVRYGRVVVVNRWMCGCRWSGSLTAAVSARPGSGSTWTWTQ